MAQFSRCDRCKRERDIGFPHVIIRETFPEENKTHYKDDSRCLTYMRGANEFELCATCRSSLSAVLADWWTTGIRLQEGKK